MQVSLKTTRARPNAREQLVQRRTECRDVMEARYLCHLLNNDRCTSKKQVLDLVAKPGCESRQSCYSLLISTA